MDDVFEQKGQQIYDVAFNLDVADRIFRLN